MVFRTTVGPKQPWTVEAKRVYGTVALQNILRLNLFAEAKMVTFFCVYATLEHPFLPASPHTPTPLLLTLPTMTSNFEPCLQRRYKWSGAQRFQF
jgi:hypothetical protein